MTKYCERVCVCVFRSSWVGFPPAHLFAHLPTTHSTQLADCDGKRTERERRRGSERPQGWRTAGVAIVELRRKSLVESFFFFYAEPITQECRNGVCRRPRGSRGRRRKSEVTITANNILLLLRGWHTILMKSQTYETNYNLWIHWRRSTPIITPMTWNNCRRRIDRNKKTRPSSNTLKQRHSRRLLHGLDAQEEWLQQETPAAICI